MHLYDPDADLKTDVMHVSKACQSTQSSFVGTGLTRQFYRVHVQWRAHKIAF